MGPVDGNRPAISRRRHENGWLNILVGHRHFHILQALSQGLL
jgi:hypothetical protein